MTWKEVACLPSDNSEPGKKFTAEYSAPCSCPFAQRGKIVLNEKGLPHTVELIDAENKSTEFLDLFRSITGNKDGKGTVPTIVDGDVKLTESNVVAEYLDRAYPEAGNRIFPEDPQKLALVRLFVEIFSAELQPLGFKILSAGSQQELNDLWEAYKHGLVVLDKYLETHGLQGGDFLLGGEFSYAEVAAIPFIYRFSKALLHYRDLDPLKFVAENKLERLDKWIQAGFARPSFKDTLAADKVAIGRLSKYFKPLQ